MNRLAALTFLLLAAAARAASPATAPFTPGPDTTLITSPTLSDGTIDYVAAINAELAKGVTSDNNAVPLLLLSHRPATGNWDDIDRVFAFLNLPGPDHSGRDGMDSFSKYVTPPGQFLTDEAFNEIDLLRSRPWTSGQHPMAPAWLDDSAAGLKLIEQAADCTRWYDPMISKPGTTGWADALPHSSVVLFDAGDALLARAMFRAGAGDFDAARADIQRLRRLARLAATEPLSTGRLVAYGASLRASKATAALAELPSLSAKQLQSLRNDLTDPAVLIADQKGTPLIEKYLALDSVMMCIRGEGAPLLDPELILNHDATFDSGDLATCDWNILLRDANRIIKEYDAIDALPTFAARKAALAAREPALVALKVPGPFLFDQPDRPSGKDVTEQYLKLRPNESRADYSHRIATLLFDDPRSGQQMNALAEREKIYRRLAQLAVDLADYHRAHHAWPDSLAALGSPVNAADPFSGKPFIYHLDHDTFTLYSVGLNEKDDNGKEDDFTITNAPPPPPATAPAPTDPPPPN